MHDRTIRTYPIGNKIRGANLYYNSTTGTKDWSGCKSCILCNGRRRVCVRKDGIVGLSDSPGISGSLPELNRPDKPTPSLSPKLSDSRSDRTPLRPDSFSLSTHAPRPTLSIRPIKLLFIGKTPRRTEDITGIPYTARSGRVLNCIFTYIPIPFEFCITNLVCCQTKDVEIIMPKIDSEEQLSQLIPEYVYSNFNRQPKPEEIIACKPHIDELISSFKPQGIIYLGQVAKNNYMTNKRSIQITDPETIAQQEYKVIPMRKEARKIFEFIKELS